MTLLTGISPLGYSITPPFISKNKTFEAERLAGQLFYGCDYVMNGAEETFVTEVLFVDRLVTWLIP
jgi:hypothetical protein